MKYTEKELLAKYPCQEGLDYARSLKFDFVAIYNQCERGDWLIWLLRKTNQITKPQAVQIAIECAKLVIDIFEKKHPTDKHPRLAIEAAEKWLAEPTNENRNAAYAAAAAYAAYAAAYAAYADAAAAYAAAAAAATAYAADAYAAAAAAATAYAADAAAAYAADAYAADAAARKRMRKKQSGIIRKIVPNPFTN